MFDEAGYIKLIDFGLSKVVLDRTYTVCGTPDYIAPEILLYKGYNQIADWWSLGIFIYELLTGIVPFYDEDPYVAYQKIITAKVLFPKFFDK